VFTWDERKRKLNLAKHGVDFRDASSFFDGPLITVEDMREDYREPRYNALCLPLASWYRLRTPSAAMWFDLSLSQGSET
jgi:uncharacterized DUF497 family protein